MEHLVDDIYTIIECMASVYDVDNTSLKDFLRDVKQCHALHQFIFSQLNKRS